MDQFGRARLPLYLSLLATLTLSPGCSDDGTGEGSESQDSTSDSTTTGPTTDPETGSASQGDGDGDPATAGDGDGDTAGDGDGDMTGDGDGDMACQEFAGEVAPIPPSVMFLLDRSGSMTELGFDDNDPDKTRWQALYEAVEGVVGNGNDATIAFGAKTFSTQGQGGCGVSNTPDVDIALDNAPNILAGIPGPQVQVNGGTPTNLALDTTMSIMQFFDAGSSDKFIFLITDGRIGCIEQGQDDAALADAVMVLDDGLMNHDITTYVVGIAPSMFGPILDQLDGMAIAGGAPKQGLEKFYRADDADQLVTALEEVLEDSYGKSCLLDLEEAPFFPEFTKVVLGDNEYEEVNNCDNDDGFIYTNDDFTQIELCGQACTDLGIEQNAEVQFFCNPG